MYQVYKVKDMQLRHSPETSEFLLNIFLKDRVSTIN